MTQIRLRYIKLYQDRHGKLRCYLRKPGLPRIALPGAPGSPAFMSAYQAAVNGEGPLIASARSGAAAGTINATISAFYADKEFLALADGTRRSHKVMLERFRSMKIDGGEHCYGEAPIAKLQKARIEKVLREFTPIVARHCLLTLRRLMRYAVAVGLRSDDPTEGIVRKAVSTEGHHTWTEEEISQFERHHPVGSRARLMLALGLYTALRASDLCRVGPQHIRDGILTIKTQKTKVEVSFPVHPDLARIIAATETAAGHLTFIRNHTGASFKAPGFSAAFRQDVKAADLPDGLTPHGLRKAACRRLAEAGCTATEIMSISGHKTLTEVQRYVAKADRVLLARNAMGKIRTGTGSV